MTDADFIAWLSDDSATRCVLVEVESRDAAGTITTHYLSDMGYVTGAADAPANTEYKSIIIGGCVVEEEVPLDGSAGMSFTGIEVDNTNGDQDAWLTYIWGKGNFRMYAGDMRWARSDFRLVFTGKIGDIAPSGDNQSLSISARDLLERLNTPITQTLVGGTSVNAQRISPLTFGEVCNLTPTLINASTVTYRTHQTAQEDIIEARDNELPIVITKNNAAGTFALTNALVGTLTCSVQGDKNGGVYINTVGDIISRLATGYGTDPIALGDLDASWAAFNTAHPQVVGISLNDRANVLEMCQGLAASIGSQFYATALGKFKLIQISLPGGAGTAITEDDMEELSLDVVSRVAVQPAIKIAYCKNWTVQTGLLTGVPPEHKDMFAQEWLFITQVDAAVAASYDLSTAPDPEETYLQKGTEASAECTRRLTMWKVQRHVIGYDGKPWLMLANVGDYQTIQHERFGLSGAATGQILKTQKDWRQYLASFQVLV